MVKKIILSKDKMKELKGFEDSLGLIGKEGAQIKEENVSFRDDSYELYSFLENEHKRLQIIDQFFSTKLKNHQSYPQLDHLIEDQSTHLKDLKLKLITKLSDRQSPLARKLNQLFQNLF